MFGCAVNWGVSLVRPPGISISISRMRNRVLSGVIWRGAAGRLAVRPEQGLEVIAIGKLTTFPGQSKYQMVIEHMEPAGEGALMALLEERKKKLAAEGLFAGRAQEAPALSAHGYWCRHLAHRRCDPRYPASGARPLSPFMSSSGPFGFRARAAPRKLPPGSAWLQRPAFGWPRSPRPDLLIVARGGGSLEDLWGFNEEAPARAVAESDIPVISAVGHETDITLIDYVADRRAPTPTGAAEIALPVRSELVSMLGDLHLRQFGAVSRMMDRRRADLRSASRALPQPRDILSLARQRYDMAAGRLGQSLTTATQGRRSRLDMANARLRPALVTERLDRQSERGQGSGAPRLGRISLLTVEQKRKQLESASRLLESLSHKGCAEAWLRAGAGSLRSPDPPRRSRGCRAGVAARIRRWLDPAPTPRLDHRFLRSHPRLPKPRKRTRPLRHRGAPSLRPEQMAERKAARWASWAQTPSRRRISRAPSADHRRQACPQPGCARQPQGKSQRYRHDGKGHTCRGIPQQSQLPSRRRPSRLSWPLLWLASTRKLPTQRLEEATEKLTKAIEQEILAPHQGAAGKARTPPARKAMARGRRTGQSVLDARPAGFSASGRHEYRTPAPK